MRSRPLPPLLTAALGLLILSNLPAALPQQPAHIERIERTFQSRDKNNDGFLEGAELTDDLRKELERWDLNNDGKISLYEYGYREYEILRSKAEKVLLKWGPLEDSSGVAFKNWLESEFKRADRNNNRVLEYNEIPNRIRNELARWDTNEDGQINQQEFRAYLIELVQSELAPHTGPLWELERWMARVQEKDLNPPPTPVFRAGNLPKGLPPWFQALDANRDGQVSLSEWLEAGNTAETFMPWDRNDDGLLTAEEVLRFMDMEKNLPHSLSLELEQRGLDWNPDDPDPKIKYPKLKKEAKKK